MQLLANLGEWSVSLPPDHLCQTHREEIMRTNATKRVFGKDTDMGSVGLRRAAGTFVEGATEGCALPQWGRPAGRARCPRRGGFRRVSLRRAYKRRAAPLAARLLRGSCEDKGGARGGQVRKGGPAWGGVGAAPA